MMERLSQLLRDHRGALPFLLLMATSFFLPTASHRIVFYLLSLPLIGMLWIHRREMREFIDTISFRCLIVYLVYFLLSIAWSEGRVEISTSDLVRNAACIGVFSMALAYVLVEARRWNPYKAVFTFSIIVMGYMTIVTLHHVIAHGSFDIWRLTLFGRYKNPIHLSFLLAFTLILLLSLPAHAQQRVNLLRIGLAALVSVFIVLTGTRSALIGVAACVILIAAAGHLRVALYVSGMIVLGLIVSFVIWDFSMGRILLRGDSFRLEIWHSVWREIVQRPILGHGVAVEPAFASNPANQGHGWKSTHNALLGHAYAGGAVGLSIYLVLIANMAWQSLKGYWREHNQGTGALSFLSAFTCLMVCFSLSISLFNFSHFIQSVHIQWLVFWTPFCLAWAMEVRNRRARRLLNAA